MVFGLQDQLNEAPWRTTMSSDSTHPIDDPFKTSGNSPPTSDGGDVDTTNRSTSEIRAEEEFKSACKAMADARRRRDTLKKRREVRELKDRSKALIAENTRLKQHMLNYQSEHTDLCNKVAALEAALEQVRADADELLEDQRGLALKANEVLSKRDETIRGLRTTIEIVENAISNLPAEE